MVRREGTTPTENDQGASDRGKSNQGEGILGQRRRLGEGNGVSGRRSDGERIDFDRLTRQLDLTKSQSRLETVERELKDMPDRIEALRADQREASGELANLKVFVEHDRAQLYAVPHCQDKNRLKIRENVTI